jgi:hypothetical protein
LRQLVDILDVCDGANASRGQLSAVPAVAVGYLLLYLLRKAHLSWCVAYR